jgi:hypothetical protein
MNLTAHHAKIFARELTKRSSSENVDKLAFAPSDAQVDLNPHQIQAALPNEASDYEWKRETGEVQSYQHNRAGSRLHIDPQGQFYDRQAQPITRKNALEQAGHSSAHSMGDNAQTHSGSKDYTDLGLSL